MNFFVLFLALPMYLPYEFDPCRNQEDKYHVWQKYVYQIQYSERAPITIFALKKERVFETALVRKWANIEMR